MLDNFFEDGDMSNIFNCTDRNYVLNQDWEIQPGDHNWWNLYFNHDLVTDLNFNYYEDEFKELKKLK